MRLLFWIVAAGVFLGPAGLGRDPTAGVVRAQAAEQAPIPLYRAGVELVALPVVVTDGQQKLVPGLEEGQFAVFEDGVRQDITFFASSHVPLDLALLLDTSASMYDKIGRLQEAASGFLSTVGPEDRVSVIDIKDTVRTLHPMDGDLAAARRAIASTTPTGGTALYNGLYTTLKEMVRLRRDDESVRRQAIAVFSDGDDTASLVAFDDVLEAARQAGVSVYTILLRTSVAPKTTGEKRFTSESEFSLKALAQETGGRAFFPDDIRQLVGVYARIAEELANQYAIGYASSNTRHDGSYRRVSVQVTSPAGLTARTRTGYQPARVASATR